MSGFAGGTKHVYVNGRLRLLQGLDGGSNPSTCTVIEGNVVRRTDVARVQASASLVSHPKAVALGSNNGS